MNWVLSFAYYYFYQKAKKRKLDAAKFQVQRNKVYDVYDMEQHF